MLLAPNENDTRCSLADWLELQTILSARRVGSKGDLLSALDIASDDRTQRYSEDTESGITLDQSILEEPRNELLLSVFDELEFRAKCLGESYPFEVDSKRMLLRAAFKDKPWHYGQVTYTFCLLTSAMRLNVFADVKALKSEEKEIALHFQVCACLAAGGYFGGPVCSFGFPRGNASAFLPALKSAYGRFGHGDVKEVIEAGHPQKVKDSGIDVIAWRDHPDGLPGKLYSLGQCASGKDWIDKPVSPKVGLFHGTWFSTAPALHCLPALFIPFLVHADVAEPLNDSYDTARRRHLAYREREFGILFDRLRIAFHAATCMAGDQQRRDTVDGAALAENVADWVNRTVSKVVGQAHMQ